MSVRLRARAGQAFSKLDARVGSDKPRRSLAIAQV
jgi:hypothetical protein